MKQAEKPKRRTRKKPKPESLPDDLLSTQHFQAKTATVYRVKNLYDTRLVVQNTPSGTRYDFLPGETKQVEAEDYAFLLAKERKQDQAVCCGGAGQNIPYFEGV